MADIIGIDSLRKNLKKYSFFKIKILRSSETLHYEYIKNDEVTQSDLMDRVEDFFSDLLETQPNNSKEYTVMLYGNDDNDYSKKSSKPFVQFKFQLMQKDNTFAPAKPVNNLPNDYIDLIKENEQLKAQMLRQNEMIEDLTSEDFEEEEEAVGMTEQEQLIGAIKDAVMPRLPQIIDYLLGNNKPATVINGIEEKEEVSKNFNSVINELKKHDMHLLSDLYILLRLAESNPQMFNLLITQLRTM